VGSTRLPGCMTQPAFETACRAVETALHARRDILAPVLESPDLRRALARLRDGMARHAFETGGGVFDLSRMVADYDRRTRREGFHALHDWDGKADHVNDDSIPVDVLNFIARERGNDAADPVAPAILLDYYFVYVLALLSMRIWDGGDPGENLDRVGRLLAMLQGPDGSGQLFAADAETLILIATSHYELEERGFRTLLDKVRTLETARQIRVALGHAPAMGCHLRFGFEATYGRDTSVMRTDNAADYPWLCFALATLMREYQRMHEARIEGPAREAVVDALVNGLTGDARAFVGEPPSSLSSCDRERQEFRERFLAHREDLLKEFEPCRPTVREYSPIAFFFNFSHNVLKGTVVDALLRGAPWPLTLNDLLARGSSGQAPSQAREALANTLMGYARSSPDRIRGRLMPVIVYDTAAGRQAFTVTMKKLRLEAPAL
jgi:hypothetical protein